MAGIFISYRREDAAGWAGRLVPDLRREFPGGDVFHDITSLGIGEDALEVIRQALESYSVVIVMIGPHWLDARDEHGQRRLDDPDDWVRLEVEESLKRRGLRVVPLLVGTATMPKAAQLPETLRPLARRVAHEISDKRWDYDVGELVKALKKSGLGGGGPKPDPEPPVVRPSEWLPGRVFRDGDGLPEMVVIPAGEFVMGSPESEAGRSADEGPQHKVSIGKAFALGRYAVTVGDFKRFVQASGYRSEAERNPDEGIWAWDAAEGHWGQSEGRSWRDPGLAQDDRHPVVGVSWNDALAYVKWLGKNTGKPYRLPSEAEWEYAARAGTTTAYPWGDDPGSGRGNFSGSGSDWSGKGTGPVGSFAPNGFGLYDMIGNALEWTQDCWNESYSGAPGDGSPWLKGDCGRRVVRGGSWLDGPGGARAACRNWVGPGGRDNGLGFRLARTL
ncbi:MAG: SUMF1/EgtB/PvdO family nonheme iron enzyme [Candidatus Accumulibacter phosphatis]|uniref:SUMF1/EgtB/PvdO family nonheme iron enzyme n=1 Tax=Candidatus Accumulibacter phosphatis TaxID=327160 RepID=UPI001A40C065|nr:SUMF1/EgtB/PvdO family nonheme iron enzyme [Candidatus Accumulibacter phosphatis]